jgi:hypothetical protein
MGSEAVCRASFAGKSSEGKALLETTYLSFRGDFRLQIPFAEISRISADDHSLSISWTGGTAEFALGTTSAKWMHKIQNPPSLMDKLGVKAGAKVALLHLEHFAPELERSGAQITSNLAGSKDFIFIGAESERELAWIAKAGTHLPEKGAIWVVYPKGRKDITETQVIRAGRDAGLIDVKVASFSPTHTALKFTARKS